MHAPVPPRNDERTFLHPRSPQQALAPERMPPPPSRRARHPLVIVGNAVFTILVLLIIAGGIGLYVGSNRFAAPGPLDRERAVEIPRATGVREIARQLQREGVIDNAFMFIVGVMVTGRTGDLKAGEYLFERGVSMREVLATIVEGRAVQYQVTIPEGLTSEQIVQRIRDAELLTGEITEVPAEGSLLPETYSVTRGVTREQLVQRMALARERVLNEIWERRAPDLPLKTKEELVTLASIVEKETGRADERTRVASVFINRLSRKMRLQSDPTIIYGIVGSQGSLGRALTRDDVIRNTPYNTYTIDGLPPGPIANPGRASLEAVANPSRTRELYFVADGTGGHVFAETYDQHLKNVARWRAYQKEQATIAAQEEAGASGTEGLKPVVPSVSVSPPAGAASASPPNASPKGGAKK